MTQEQLDEREYERVEVQIAYEEFIKACSKAGGVTYSDRKVKSKLDLKMVRCVSRESVREALRGLGR